MPTTESAAPLRSKEFDNTALPPRWRQGCASLGQNAHETIVCRSLTSENYGALTSAANTFNSGVSA